MNERIILRREKQISPKFNLSREKLRKLARKHNVPRGRNTGDTATNLFKAGLAAEVVKAAFNDEVRNII